MDELLREVQAEKEYILDTLRALNEALQRKEKTAVELAAISTFLQNTYNGIENILKRILIYFFLKNPIRSITHIFDFDLIFRVFSFINCSISHFYRFLSIATAILYGTLLFERT